MSCWGKILLVMNEERLMLEARSSKLRLLVVGCWLRVEGRSPGLWEVGGYLYSLSEGFTKQGRARHVPGTASFLIGRT